MLDPLSLVGPIKSRHSLARITSVGVSSKRIYNFLNFFAYIRLYQKHSNIGVLFKTFADKEVLPNITVTISKYNILNKSYFFTKNSEILAILRILYIDMETSILAKTFRSFLWHWNVFMMKLQIKMANLNFFYEMRW